MLRFQKWLIIALVVLLALMLLRAGAMIPASVLGFILFLAAITEKVMNIRAAQAKAGRKFEVADTISTERARQILGVSEGATEEEVQKAYKSAIARNHPDAGGSEYLAAQINQARDVLLENKGKK